MKAVLFAFVIAGMAFAILAAIFRSGMQQFSMGMDQLTPSPHAETFPIVSSGRQIHPWSDVPVADPNASAAPDPVISDETPSDERTVAEVEEIDQETLMAWSEELAQREEALLAAEEALQSRETVDGEMMADPQWETTPDDNAAMLEQASAQQLAEEAAWRDHQQWEEQASFQAQAAQWEQERALLERERIHQQDLIYQYNQSVATHAWAQNLIRQGIDPNAPQVGRQPTGSLTQPPQSFPRNGRLAPPLATMATPLPRSAAPIDTLKKPIRRSEAPITRVAKPLSRIATPKQ